MVFPREIMWLGGAPGSGKGTNTGFIMRERGYTAEPIVVSSLLNSPEMQKIKAEGGLVGDKEVIKLLFEELLKPEYRTGVVVDGMPRTKIQAKVVSRLHDKMMQLRNIYRNDPEKGNLFERPIFRICVLFVDEMEAVARQLGRGEKAMKHNEKVDRTGKGVKQDIRPTDMDPALAAKRYKSFEDQTLDALEYLGELFIYNLINAQGSYAKVEENIIKEMEYQSSLELNPETHDIIHELPRADEIIQHARQNLVRRLDGYAKDHEAMFVSVTSELENDCYPLIAQNVIGGRCEYVFNETDATNELKHQMAMDILSDRGFQASISPNHATSSASLQIEWDAPKIRS